jgi:K+-sensing histidine kinase KdpD
MLGVVERVWDGSTTISPPSMPCHAYTREEETVLASLRHRRVMPLYWIVLSILIIAADHLTDPYIQFPILFLVPVTLAAVYHGRWWGVGLAVGMPWFRCYFESRAVPWAVPQEAINTVICVVVLAGFAILVDRTARQTRTLMQEVKILRGLLPICSFCKKIRKENNVWEHIEQYVTEHSEAQFSHGLCPNCLQEHYSGFTSS